MKNHCRKLTVTILSVLIVFGLSMTSYATMYSMGDVGPGSTEAEIQAALEKAKQSAGTGSDSFSEPVSAPKSIGLKMQDGYYLFEGKKYRISSDWGEHKLTGYTGEKTASGSRPVQYHTCSASSELPFGTVVIVEGVSGPEKDNYNGIYVVEDRGGALVEDGTVIDLYFNDEYAANEVTHKGWTVARVWIAEEVK